MRARLSHTNLVSALLSAIWILCFCTASATAADSNNGPKDGARTKAATSTAYGTLPLSFEANQGQTDRQVKFLSRGLNYGLFLTSTEAVLSLKDGTGPSTIKDLVHAFSRPQKLVPQKFAVLRMRLERANSNGQIRGLGGLPGKSNYFIGKDPAKWLSNIPTFTSVKYQQVYPGVDLVYYGNQRQLEYDFVLAPGADPKQIEISFNGAKRLRLDANGNLILDIGDDKVIEHKPIIYQIIDGMRRRVAGAYELKNSQTVRFKVASYDPHQSLTIDPSLVLVYSTYLGGSGGEIGNGIAVDPAGNAYVAGFTASSDFPTTAGALKTSSTDNGDAFVSKLNSSGSALVYSTYLGGSGGAFGDGIALDSAGNAYVTGVTGPNFPTTAGAFQTSYPGDASAFISKLNSSGSALVYSTYLGGNNIDEAAAIAVDSAGNAYVVGSTQCASPGPVPCSSIFPITPGAFQTTFNGFQDAFVSELNSAGSALVYSTYFGGSNFAEVNGVAVDSSGNAYVVGTTDTDFPTTAGAFQTTFGGEGDAFVSKLNSSGSALIYSTYLGGCCNDEGTQIAVDAAGDAYVTGVTNSTNFPTTPGAFQTSLAGGYNGFVSKLNSSGSTLLYSTYLGGSGSFDEVSGIAVDGAGNAFVTGAARSSNFPTTLGAFQTTFGGGDTDSFVSELNSSGSALRYSTYLGGSNTDVGVGIAIDATDNAYVTGYTFSSDFPTTPGAFQITLGGGSGNAFVSKLAPSTTTFSGIFRGSLTISSGLTYITNGTVTGSITQNGGSLFVSNSTIRGNLQTNHGGTFSIENTTVNGNLLIRNGGDLFTVNAAIGGNLQISGGGGFSIENTVVNGNLQIQNIPVGSTQNQICGTHVRGNLQFDDNRTAVAIGTTSASCPGNTIGGNLQVNSNFGAVEVFDDSARGNLQCQNDFSITGGDDTARLLQGQCADF